MNVQTQPLDPKTQGLGAKTQGLDLKTQGLGTKTQGRRVPDPGLSQSLSQSLPQTLPGQDFEASVASVAEKSWARREQVQAAILEVCRGQFCTAREIAARLGRSFTTIRKNYLAQLVAEGRLELKDPQSPRSPEQAYRTRGAKG